MPKPIQIGDEVQYSAKFLRSTGQYTGPVPFARGRVLELHRFGGGELAVIEWNDDELPIRVLAANLKRIGDMELP